MAVDRSEWPFLVKLGLWSVRSPAAAWAYLVLSLVIGLAGIAYAVLYDPRGYLAVVMFLAALWYLACIRWVNRHGQWG